MVNTYRWVTVSLFFWLIPVATSCAPVLNEIEAAFSSGDRRVEDTRPEYSGNTGPRTPLRRRGEVAKRTDAKTPSDDTVGSDQQQRCNFGDCPQERAVSAE